MSRRQRIGIVISGTRVAFAFFVIGVKGTSCLHDRAVRAVRFAETGFLAGAGTVFDTFCKRGGVIGTLSGRISGEGT